MVEERDESESSDGLESRRDRYEAGKVIRRKVPRSRQAAWSLRRDRPDPLEILEDSDRSRVRQLLPIRYGRMALSAFAFLRGSANLMANDLAATPQTGLRVQLGGDAHLSNFGVFGTPEGNEVFDLNDFDETLPGPWEWGLKRLAVSLVVAGRCNGFSRERSRELALRAARSYRRTVNTYATMRYLDIWYSHLDPRHVPRPMARGARRVVERYARRATAHTPLHAFPKVVRRVDGRYRIRDQAPLIMRYSSEKEAEVFHALFDRYLATLSEERRMLLGRYHPVDVAQKVGGVGSVGTVCSIVLLMGDQDTNDPLFLQIKQALPSALERFAGTSHYSNHAQRVVVGQRLIQQASDLLLGWTTLRSRDFYVRQIWDVKFSADPASMGPKVLTGYGELCAAALARAHARTGDAACLSGYLGTKDVFDQAIATFAEAYAGQVAADYAEFLQAVKKGRIPARSDT